VSYWREEAKKIKWKTFPKTILQVNDLHFHRWFADGEMNITEQCLEANLETNGNLNAYLIESPITGHRSSITYTELHRRVVDFSGSLQ
jgi:propionyl-CoA synthetase